MVDFILSMWRDRTSLEKLVFRSEPGGEKLVEIPTDLFLEDAESLSTKAIAEWLASLIEELYKYESINNTLKLLSSKPLACPRGAASGYKKEWAELDASELKDSLSSISSLRYSVDISLTIITNSEIFNTRLRETTNEIVESTKIDFLVHPDYERSQSKLEAAIEKELNEEYDLSEDLRDRLSAEEKDSNLWQLYLSSYWYWERNILYPQPELRVIPITKKTYPRTR